MASSSARAPLAANSPLKLGFYIIPSGTADEERRLREAIHASGAEIKHSALTGAISVVANSHDVKALPNWIDVYLHTHSIYRSSIIEALVEDPTAIDNEEHIWQKKKPGPSSLNRVPRPAPDTNSQPKKGDRRRLEQPDEDDLPAEHRQFLAKSKELYLSETYVNPATADSSDRKRLFVKRVRVPPPVPGSPPAKRRVDADGRVLPVDDGANATPSSGASSRMVSTQPGVLSHEHLKNAFYGPPLALSDAIRAADPAERNFMVSEDFAILVWYARTIPYCGADDTQVLSAKYRTDYHQYRWNWARTHGICLRPITSLQERWRRVVSQYFNGKEPLPEGTFRTYLAQTGFFYFANDKILTYNMAAIKDANSKCLTNLDIDPSKDPYSAVSDDDRILYQDTSALVSNWQFLPGNQDKEVHEGQRWHATEDA